MTHTPWSYNTHNAHKYSQQKRGPTLQHTYYIFHDAHWGIASTQFWNRHGENKNIKIVLWSVNVKQFQFQVTLLNTTWPFPSSFLHINSLLLNLFKVPCFPEWKGSDKKNWVPFRRRGFGPCIGCACRGQTSVEAKLLSRENNANLITAS